MSVKRIKSVARMLTTFEAIAEHQPIGVGALARLLDDDKSAQQRAIMTLADEGWIRPAPGEPTRWETTARIHVLGHLAQGYSGLRQRARVRLDALRSRTGESIMLAVPDSGRIVVVDVLESPQIIRTAPYVGMVISFEDSASGAALLSRYEDEEQQELLGRPLNAAECRRIAEVRKRGWAVNDEVIVPGSTNFAAAIMDHGRPVAAVVVSGPTERLTQDQHEHFGRLVAQAATDLSTE